MAVMLNVALYFVVAYFTSVAAQIRELDERFLEFRKEGFWLVEFYAPWCGHCKRLEPIYHEVYLALENSPIIVAKLDSTKYSSIATEFDIRGFPTIKFFNGENVYTHRGDRTKEDIVEFAKRAQGPPVRKLQSLGKFNEAKSQHSDGVLFLYVGDDDPNFDLYVKYLSIAEEQLVHAYFYSGEERILPKNVKPKNTPTVLVFKDKSFFEYEAPDNIATKSSLGQWVSGERYSAFPRVSGGNLNEMFDSKKFIVLTAADDSNFENKVEHQRVKGLSNMLATKEREEFHEKFQFVWLPDAEPLNSITMSSMNFPSIIVFDSETQYYYIPEKKIEDITVDDYRDFLRRIVKGNVQAYGGTSFLQRLKRVFYDLFMTVLGVWQTSRWLFLLMFGLPTIIISIVCYSICCMEPVEEDIVSDDEEEEEENSTDNERRKDGMNTDRSNHPKAD